MGKAGWNKTRDESLLELIRKVGLDCRRVDDSGDVPRSADILHPDTMHVSLESVVRDVWGTRRPKVLHLRNDLEDITPPFERMWLEMVIGKGTFGAYLHRSDIGSDFAADRLPQPAQVLGAGPYRHLVRAWLFYKGKNLAIPTCINEYVTDQYGQVGIASALCSWFPEVHAAEDGRGLACKMIYTALEGVVRINTRETELREITGRSVPRLKPLETPACVWHEIVIKPKGVVYHGAEVSQSKRDAAERREHWCRAHRRRVRGSLFWVREHKRGNPNLGITIPEYKI